MFKILIQCTRLATLLIVLTETVCYTVKNKMSITFNYLKDKSHPNNIEIVKQVSHLST
jgi:hypothetical protein